MDELEAFTQGDGLAPCPELREILMPAMAPCAGFGGACKDQCKWQPKKGHIPRGFCGATGARDQVRLVLVTAEPAEPGDGDGESYSGDAQTFVEQTAVLAATLLRDNSLRRNGRSAPYHPNLLRILELCWPNLPFEEQLRRTWVTDSVLCTARGEIDPRVADECVKRYLAPQIEALPHAFVIALGDKAKRRMRRHGVEPDATAQHPSAWGTHPEISWQEAADKFRNWLAELAAISSEPAEISSELAGIEAAVADPPVPKEIWTALAALKARYSILARRWLP